MDPVQGARQHGADLVMFSATGATTVLLRHDHAAFAALCVSANA